MPVTAIRDDNTTLEKTKGKPKSEAAEVAAAWAKLNDQVTATETALADLKKKRDAKLKELTELSAGKKK